MRSPIYHQFPFNVRFGGVIAVALFLLAVSGGNLALGQEGAFYDPDGNQVEPWPGFPPTNITDGDPSTLSHPMDQATTGYYFELDLGGDHVITSVDLTGRSDCCQDRLENVTLSIVNSLGDEVFSQVLTDQIVETQTIDLSADSPTGQLIRITNTGGADYSPQINEMAVSATPADPVDLGNLALGKESAFYDLDGNQVNPWPGFPTTNITDGDPTTLSHPMDQASADYYYELDLGADYTLTSIDLTGRDDCCPERLENVTLSIINSLGAEVLSQVLADQIVATQSIDLSAGSPTGRFIRVINTGGFDYAPQINEMAVAGNRAVLDDQDDDGLPDGWEIANNLDETSADGVNGAAGDPDEDGLPNVDELERETDPQDPDSDDDTLLDGAEVAGADGRPATNPLDADTDGDTLSDAVETNTGVFVSATDTGSNPTLVDTDSDGTNDGVEVENGADPNDAAVGSNLAVGKFAQFYDAEGNPVEPWPGFLASFVNDGDISTFAHPVEQASSDYYFELDLGGEFKITGVELTGRDNCCQDRLENVTLSVHNLVGDEVFSRELTDQIVETQLIDLSDVSPQGQYVRITNTGGVDYSPQINEMAIFGSQGTVDDVDGDGLPNSWEIANNLDENSGEGVNGAAGDPDEDGLSNLDELNARTDPQNPDSDGDTLLDGAEVTGTETRPATDPLSADTDEDSLSDAAESNTGVFVSAGDTGTNPTLVDTDGDGTPDGTELDRGSNPNDPSSGGNLATGLVGRFYDADGNPVEPWGNFVTDNITDGDPASISHPLDEASANYYYELDLGQDATITSVELTGRGFRDACCADRLENVTLSIVDSLGEEVFSEVFVDQIIMTETFDLSAVEPRGQFIRVINTFEASYGPQLGEVSVFGSFTPATPILITSVARDEAGIVSLDWTSEPGQFFDLQMSETLLPNDWTRILKAAPASAEGMLTSAMVDTGDALATYFRVKRVPPPATFSDDFEGGDEGWTVVTNGIESETTWERGAPSNVGPAAANSGANVYGTDLDAAYAEDLLSADNTGIALRTPVIDLLGDTSVKLAFSYFLDLAADEQGGGRVNILNENGELIETLSPLLVVDDGVPMGEWTPFGPVSLSNTVTGQGKIIVEFEFLSVESAEAKGGGLYIDDVVVN